jgi:hypothetical protein
MSLDAVNLNLTKTTPPPKTYHTVPKIDVSIVDMINGFDLSPDRIHFCYLVLEKTLTCLIEHEYSKFDPHTSTSCCHGMALLVCELINLAQESDLKALRSEVQRKIHQGNEIPSLSLPKALVKLCQLFILTFAVEVTPNGTRTDSKKLLDIAPIFRNFATKLIQKLKKHYANIVAHRYEKYLSEMQGKIKTCDIPIDVWGKYTFGQYLRTCKDGFHYTSSLYSMQVVLAYIIYSRTKIAVINDILDQTGKIVQYLTFLQGDGRGGFFALDFTQGKLQENDNHEPIVVFSGCAKALCAQKISRQMDEWMHSFPNLVLAHEITYPQFPRTTDEQFNSEPIQPEEQALSDLIDEHKKVTGLSAKDPSFFYLNHIYTSSFKTILMDFANPRENPLSFKILSAVAAKE